jgi:hypothetical protein
VPGSVFNNRLPALDAFCILGKLALSGQLRPFKGVLSIALEAKQRQPLIYSGVSKSSVQSRGAS